jgi:RND family efflux transporter MFP subunit
VPVREEQVTRSIDATGTLAAQDQVALAMKVTGRLESITVDLGDRVKQGQVIATLDPTELKIGVQQAEAALQQARTRLGLMPEGSAERVVPERTATVRQAKATLDETKVNRDRAKQLFDAKLIARSDFDAAIAAYQVAEGRYQDAIEEIRNRQAVLAQRRSDLALAKQQLADGVLRSPMDGAVYERQASAGQFVAAGTPIVTIVKLHPLRLRLPVPERAATGVRIGQRVVIRLDQDPNEYSGRITRLSPAIDESNRTLLVEAEIPNERGTLRPGAFVRAELMMTGEHPALFVPASALVTFAGLEKVISVQDGRSVEKTVTTGRKTEEKIEIAEGLRPGDLVVVRPGNLTGGQPVVPVRQ